MEFISQAIGYIFNQSYSFVHPFQTHGRFDLNKQIGVLLIFWLVTNVTAQSFFVPSDTFNTKRFNTALIFSATAYTTFSIGLYNTWYKNYDQESFHFFNDIGEWQQMDKVGHLHTAYLQGFLCYKGANWTGLSKNKSIITGMVCSTLFQSTIEVMDGFSSKWGFSWGDMAANLAGTLTFAAQQYYWDDQRISIKVSSIPISHPKDPIISTDGSGHSSLYNRSVDLYGTSYLERFLKDYNAQTYWASFNVNSFLAKGNKWPKWLNLAVGYGGENMYGGYENIWREGDHTFKLDDNIYPRYRQFYLGFDLDLPKLNPKNPFLKTICSVFNIFKIPSPALEFNTEGKVVFHLLR